MHECMTIEAGCIDYGETNFLFSQKYVSNFTWYCLTVDLMSSVSSIPAYLSSNITSYVCPAH